MDATTLKARLSDPSPQGALARLAALSVDAVWDTPVGALLSSAQLAQGARALAQAWVASPSAPQALRSLVEEVVAKLQSDRRSLHEVLSADVRAAMREVVGRPFSPDKRLVLTIIDREPTRALVRQLLVDLVLDFGRRVSAPVAGVAKGLGALARMAGETVKARSGGLGGLVGAVSSEVERQLEKRAIEFVDAALGGVFGELADALSNPQRAEEAAELRMAVFDGVLELTSPQLARELMNADIDGGAEVLRQGVERYLASARSQPELEQLAAVALEGRAGRPLRQVLADWGLADEARALAIEHLTARMQAVVATPAFAAWLEALVG